MKTIFFCKGICEKHPLLTKFYNMPGGKGSVFKGPISIFTEQAKKKVSVEFRDNIINSTVIYHDFYDILLVLQIISFKPWEKIT